MVIVLTPIAYNKTISITTPMWPQELRSYNHYNNGCIMPHSLYIAVIGLNLWLSSVIMVMDTIYRPEYGKSTNTNTPYR